MKKLTVLLTMVLLVSIVAGVSAAPQPPMTAKGNGVTERVPGTGGIGTLWENGEWDGVNGLASELNTAVSDARTADDFWLDPSCSLYNISVIRTQLAQSSNPLNAIVEIYADSGNNSPGALLYTFPWTSYVYIGLGWGWINIYEVTFNTPGLQLAGGQKYWVSGIGLGDGSYADRAFFCTTGNGAVQLTEGHFGSNYFGIPYWTPVSQVIGTNDFAFDIDGSCAAQPTLTCGAIIPQPAVDPYGNIYVRWLVEAIDVQSGLNVPLVTVDANLWWPTGGPVARTRLTHFDGFARFPWGSHVSGPWQIDVTNMTLAGYTFAYGPQCLASGYW